MREHNVAAPPPAPDFYHYLAKPIALAEWAGDTVVLRWHDDKRLSCHRFGYGKTHLVMVVLIRRPEKG